MPLRETRGPLEISEDSTLQPGCPVIFRCQPFSTADLVSWKQHTLPYSEKPQAMSDLLESILNSSAYPG